MEHRPICIRSKLDVSYGVPVSRKSHGNIASYSASNLFEMAGHSFFYTDAKKKFMAISDRPRRLSLRTRILISRKRRQPTFFRVSNDHFSFAALDFRSDIFSSRLAFPYLEKNNARVGGPTGVGGFLRRGPHSDARAGNRNTGKSEAAWPMMVPMPLFS